MREPSRAGPSAGRPPPPTDRRPPPLTTHWAPFVGKWIHVDFQFLVIRWSIWEFRCRFFSSGVSWCE